MAPGRRNSPRDETWVMLDSCGGNVAKLPAIAGAGQQQTRDNIPLNGMSKPNRRQIPVPPPPGHLNPRPTPPSPNSSTLSSRESGRDAREASAIASARRADHSTSMANHPLAQQLAPLAQAKFRQKSSAPRASSAGPLEREKRRRGHNSDCEGSTSDEKMVQSARGASKLAQETQQELNAKAPAQPPPGVARRPQKRAVSEGGAARLRPLPSPRGESDAVAPHERRDRGTPRERENAAESAEEKRTRPPKSTSGGSSSSKCTRSEDHLLGKWTYGDNASYQITEVGAGCVRFQEADLLGNLTTSGNWFMGELADGKEIIVGMIRIKYRDGKLISNILAVGEAEWGDDTIATKDSLASSSASRHESFGGSSASREQVVISAPRAPRSASSRPERTARHSSSDQGLATTSQRSLEESQGTSGMHGDQLQSSHLSEIALDAAEKHISALEDRRPQHSTVTTDCAAESGSVLVPSAAPAEKDGPKGAAFLEEIEKEIEMWAIKTSKMLEVTDDLEESHKRWKQERGEKIPDSEPNKAEDSVSSVDAPDAAAGRSDLPTSCDQALDDTDEAAVNSEEVVACLPVLAHQQLDIEEVEDTPSLIVAALIEAGLTPGADAAAELTRRAVLHIDTILEEEEEGQPRSRARPSEKKPKAWAANRLRRKRQLGLGTPKGAVPGTKALAALPTIMSSPTSAHSTPNSSTVSTPARASKGTSRAAKEEQPCEFEESPTKIAASVAPPVKGEVDFDLGDLLGCVARVDAAREEDRRHLAKDIFGG